LWTVPSAGGFIAGSLLAPALVRVVRPAVAVAGGLVLTAVGLALLAQVEAGSSVALVVVASIVIALGVAPPVTLGTDLVVGCVAPERAGVASGISETSAELGGALGIAVLGSLGVAVYRNELADSVPAGVSQEESEAAQDTLAGAVDAVETLPETLGTQLLDAAQNAFTQGLQVAAVASAAVALATAAVVGVLLRRMGADAVQTQEATAASKQAA
jgi:DHA2 family multidrug resistance protein-like MFS transporter